MGVYKVTYPGTGKISYGVDYRDPGGRKIRRIVSDRKKVADAIWAKIHVELETGAYYDRKQIKTFTIKDLIEKYLEWFRGRRSFETEKTHLSAIAAHFDRKVVCDITEHDVIAFRNIRQDTPTRNGTPRTPAAVNREISVLKRLLGKAVTWGMARTNVASGVKPLKEPKGRLRYLEVEEAGRLLQEAAKSDNPHLYPILLTALETGMRRGEIMKLRRPDLDIKNGRIYIPDTKIGEPRHAPVSSKLMVVLSKIPPHPDTDFFFAGKDGDPYHDVRTSFENACRRARIRDFHFHDLRHNADSRIMPTRESRGRWNRGIPRICHCCRRHNQRDSRKASSVSPGLYHPGFTPIGVVLERASCFNRRSAWRYICVVSTDS